MGLPPVLQHETVTLNDPTLMLQPETITFSNPTFDAKTCDGSIRLSGIDDKRLNNGALSFDI